MLSCLLRFGDDGPFGLLDVNWLTPEKRRELCVIGEAGMLVASYLTQDVWLTEAAGSAKNWDTLARLGGDVESSTVRFGLRRVEPCRRSSRRSPSASSTTRRSRSPPTTDAAH